MTLELVPYTCPSPPHLRGADKHGRPTAAPAECQVDIGQSSVKSLCSSDAHREARGSVIRYRVRSRARTATGLCPECLYSGRNQLVNRALCSRASAGPPLSRTKCANVRGLNVLSYTDAVDTLLEIPACCPSRFFLLRRRCIHMLPGWDGHGLPIELKALHRLQTSQRSRVQAGHDDGPGSASADTQRPSVGSAYEGTEGGRDVLKLREEARKVALHYTDLQKKDFQR